MIRLSNITKNFRDGDVTVHAVNDVSLTLDEGKFVAIVGPSGSGKSTLLTVIGALQRPTQGSLEIDGVDIYSIPESKLSDIRFRKLGFVLQGSNLVPYLTVKEQFLMKAKVAKSERKFDTQELLTKLEVDHLVNKYPDELSGGERQRVAIALSLYLRPSIILADEPTASLDTEKAYDVVNLLKEVTRTMQTTVVMVTHDVRMLKECDAVYEMVDGSLSVSNTH